MTKLLEDKKPGVRTCAAAALGLIGDTGDGSMRHAIPALVRHLHDPDKFVRADVTYTLGRLHLEPELVVSPLITELQSTNLDLLKDVTLRAIGNYGSNALSAVEILQEYTTNRNAVLRGRAKHALSQITNNLPPDPY